VTDELAASTRLWVSWRGAHHLVTRVTGATGHNPFALDRAFVPPRGKTR
jgi:hypothetical protein